MIYPGLPTMTFRANEVCGAADALFLGSNPFFTGQLVQYESRRRRPIGGLVSGNYYTVIRSADGSTIQLATLGGTLVVDLDPSVDDARAPPDRRSACRGRCGRRHLPRPEGGAAQTMPPVTEFTATIDSLTAGGTIDLLAAGCGAGVPAPSATYAGVRVTTIPTRTAEMPIS